VAGRPDPVHWPLLNPWELGRLTPGERALDRGSGAGTDSLVAAQMVGEHGSVTGIDMTPEMLAKARTAAAEIGRCERRVRRERGGTAAVPERELQRRDLRCLGSQRFGGPHGHLAVLID
jgi:tRNA A58 N-methylase Trm61